MACQPSFGPSNLLHSDTEFKEFGNGSRGVTSADQAAVTIKSWSKDALRQLRVELAQDREAAELLLPQLAIHTDPVVGDWVGWAASRVLPRESAISLLKLLAEDADADVRMEAKRFLVDLDPA